MENGTQPSCGNRSQIACIARQKQVLRADGYFTPANMGNAYPYFTYLSRSITRMFARETNRDDDDVQEVIVVDTTSKPSAPPRQSRRVELVPSGEPSHPPRQFSRRRKPPENAAINGASSRKVVPSKRPADASRNPEPRNLRPRTSITPEDLTVPGGGPRSTRRNVNPAASHHGKNLRARLPNDNRIVNLDADDDEIDEDCEEPVRRTRTNPAHNTRTSIRGIIPRRPAKPKMPPREHNYNVNQVRKDRQRREGNRSDTLPRRSKSPEQPIQIEDDDDDDEEEEEDDDAIKITRQKSSALRDTFGYLPDGDVEKVAPPPPDPSRMMTRRQSQQRLLSKQREEDEVAEEVKELTAIDAPYSGPTHFIFRYPPAGRGSIRVTAEERERLNMRKYLNDSLIDFYLKFLENSLNVRPRDIRFTTKFFSSFFFGVLRREKPGDCKSKTPIDYNGVKSWTKGIDLFSLEYVFVPICDSYHWSLIIVANLHELERFLESLYTDKEDHGRGSPKIIYLDSLDPKRGTEFGNTMLHYLVEEYLTRKKKAEVTDVLRKETFARFRKAIPIRRALVPIQTNEYDCGLYVLNSLTMFLEDRDGFMAKLLNPEPTVDVRNMYSHMDVQKLRMSITILMDIFEADWKAKHKSDSDLPEAKDDMSLSDGRDAVEEFVGEEANGSGRDASALQIERNSASPPRSGSINSPPTHEDIEPMKPEDLNDVFKGPQAREVTSHFDMIDAENLTDGAGSSVKRNVEYIGREDEDGMELDDSVKREKSESDLADQSLDVMQGFEEVHVMDIDGGSELIVPVASDDSMEECAKASEEDGDGPYFNTSANPNDGRDIAMGQCQLNGEAEDVVKGERSAIIQDNEETDAKRYRKSTTPARRKRRLPSKSHSGAGDRKQAPLMGYGGGGRSIRSPDRTTTRRDQRGRGSRTENEMHIENVAIDKNHLTHRPGNADEEILDGSEYVGE